MQSLGATTHSRYSAPAMPPPPRLPELRAKTAPRDDRIVQFYTEGLTLVQVSRALHTSIDTARMVLNERGIARRRKTDEDPALKIRNDFIVEAYQKGRPLTEIAK